jgi:1-acyl-sn-glycerol-3-phosphate acyltransferase
VPIIPVCLRRLGIVLPKGARVPVPLFCDAVVGPPVIDRPSDADAFIHSLEKTMSRLRAIADHGVG